MAPDSFSAPYGQNILKRSAVGLLLVVLVAGGASWLWLATRPGISLSAARGLYAEEGTSVRYRWTTNLAAVPIRRYRGPSLLRLVLAEPRPRAGGLPTVAIGDGAGAVIHVTIAPEPRRYHLMLPAASGELVLRAPLERAPEPDGRWLGIQLRSAALTRYWGAGEVGLRGLLATFLTIPLVLLVRWTAYRDYGPLALLTVLALVVRVYRLHSAPPGFNQDEAVSLVDAWHLLYTGRDHLGNRLPLAAFEALGDWVSPLLTYMQLPWVAILGPGPFAGRLATAVAGTLAVPASYMLARAANLSRPASLCTALVVALSPWQTFLSRFAIPPALVPVSWTLCVWAALRFLQGSTRATGLALVAGLGLYAYPTMKLAVPLLVAWAVLLRLMCDGRRAARAWLVPAVLLMALWLPFVGLTFLNEQSGTRFNQTLLRASSPGEWLAKWAAGYLANLRPGFLYRHGDGDPIHGVPGHGMELGVAAPLALLGVGALAWQCAGSGTRTNTADERRRRFEAWLLAGATALGPLPASLTAYNPHPFRAAALAPMYALVVGFGCAAAVRIISRIRPVACRRVIWGAASSAFVVALCWQAGAWFRDYLTGYPPPVAPANQDGLLETMQRAIKYAPRYDEVRFEAGDMIAPHVYLLAAQPMPPPEAQAKIEVIRQPGRFNVVRGIGVYRFDHWPDVPDGLPVLDAITDRYGGAAYVIQEWQDAGRRVLLVRRMIH